MSSPAHSAAYRRGYSRVLDVALGLCKSADEFLTAPSGPTALSSQSWWDRNVASPFRRFQNRWDRFAGSAWHGARAGVYDGAGDVVSATRALGSSMVRPLGNTVTDAFNSAMTGVEQAARNRAGYIRSKHDFDSATVPGKPETYGTGGKEYGSTAPAVAAASTGIRAGVDAAAAYYGVRGPLAALGNSSGTAATTLRAAGGAGNLIYAGEEAGKGNYGTAALYGLAGTFGMAGPAGKGVVGAAQRVLNVPSKVVSAPVGAAVAQTAKVVPGVTRAAAVGQTYVPATMASLPDPKALSAMAGKSAPVTRSVSAAPPGAAALRTAARSTDSK